MALDLNRQPPRQSMTPKGLPTAAQEAEALEVTYRGKTIAQVVDLSIEETAEFFADERFIRHELGTLQDLGLDYLKLGHPATKLSGGEAQRIKLAHRLGKVKRGRHNIYSLDEPTTGLHLADVQKPLDGLNFPDASVPEEPEAGLDGS